jgi:hypothetical protein
VSIIASTATTNLVVLTLIPATIGAVSPSFEIGSAAVAAISAPWTCDARIPSFAPPGHYTLTATLAGQFLASTPITVTGALAPGRPRGRVYTKHIYISVPDVSPLQEDATGVSTNYYHSGIC